MSKYYTWQRKLRKIYKDAHERANDIDRVKVINIVNDPIYLFRKLSEIVLLSRQDYGNNDIHIVQRFEKLSSNLISMFKVEKIEYPYDITDGFQEHIPYDMNWYWRQVTTDSFDFHLYLYSNQYFNAQVEAKLHYLSERSYDEVRYNKE